MVTLLLEKLARSVAGEVHLEEADLSFEAGTFHVLLGPTQAGKTSLLRLIAGLDRPSAGRVSLEGEPRGRQGATGLRGRVAMVYQDFVNYPSLSVRQNIASPLRARGLPKAEIGPRVQVAAERVGLDGLLERLPAELSGGQQQRLAIARALVQEAAVVLLDEPLANLDYKLREDLREEVRELFTGSDTVVLYATTDPAEALWFAGQVVVMHAGRVLQRGRGREVYDRPVSERVAQITSDPPINLWAAQLEEGTVRLSPEIAFDVPAHLDRSRTGPCRVGVRPHQLRTLPGPSAVRLPLRVSFAEVDGSTTRMHGSAGELTLTALQDGVRDLRPGEELDVFLDPGDLLVFDAGGRLLSARR